MAERRYCKNTVPGRQGRGKKYPAKVRAEVVMAMIGTNSICAVARKYGVPESTIRSWVAEEAKKPDGEFAKARAEAAREIAARAALGAKAQVSYLQQRAAENQRAAEIRTKLQQRLDEDARARNYELGVLLKSEEENLQDAAETGLVIRSAPEQLCICIWTACWQSLPPKPCPFPAASSSSLLRPAMPSRSSRSAQSLQKRVSSL